MRNNIVLAVLVTGGLALLAGHNGTAHAENLSDKLQKLKDTANSLTAATQATAFDGVWFSKQWRYGFKIQGKTGIATQSNSPKFAPGDVILRIDSVSGQTFRGSQIYKDGVWRQVTGQLANGILRVSGPSGSWDMTRVASGSADQGKAAAQTTTQSPASTGQGAVTQSTSTASAPLDTNVPDGPTSIQISRVGKFDVQGVRLGMSSKEIEAVLLKRGYKGSSTNTNTGTDTFTLPGPNDNKSVIVTHAILSGTYFAHRIQYRQRFTGRFDPAAAKEQVLAKYGKPIKEQGESLIYTDGTEDPYGGNAGQPALLERVKAQCAQEILKRGGVRGLELGEAGAATTPGMWLEFRGSRVKERCPDTLPAYLDAIRASRAPRMTVNISPSRLELLVELNSIALQEEPVRLYKLREEERLRKAPVSKGDL